MARRRDVDRLFEVRAIEGVGLVEHGQHVESAAAEQGLHRHFRSGHEGLDQERLGRVLARAIEDRPDARRRLHRGGHAVSPDHATAGRQRQRLDHTGQPHLGGEGADVIAGPRHGEGRLGHTCAGQEGPHARLVASRPHGIGRVVTEAQPLAGQGGDHHALVVDGHHGIERGAPVQGDVFDAFQPRHEGVGLGHEADEAAQLPLVAGGPAVGAQLVAEDAAAAGRGRDQAHEELEQR